VTLSWVIRIDDSSGFVLDGGWDGLSSSSESRSLSPANLGFVGV